MYKPGCSQNGHRARDVTNADAGILLRVQIERSWMVCFLALEARFCQPSNGQNLALDGSSSLGLAEDLNGHRDANNFIGFPTLRQVHRLQ